MRRVARAHRLQMVHGMTGACCATSAARCYAPGCAGVARCTRSARTPHAQPTWKPPESVSMPLGHPANSCSPPMAATRSLPGLHKAHQRRGVAGAVGLLRGAEV